jgi:hypothetical protein
MLVKMFIVLASDSINKKMPFSLSVAKIQISLQSCEEKSYFGSGLVFW